MEASQTRDLLRRKERAAPRGSPRSLTAQRTLARDNNQIRALPGVFYPTIFIIAD
jgi:hypothetical protein